MSSFISNLTIEGLTVVGDNGRVKPWLAKDWAVSTDGRVLTVSLRPEARFHDGLPVSAPVVAGILQKTLAQFAGPAADDIETIEAVGQETVRIRLKRPSQFVLESLETSIQETDSPWIGTGPFKANGPTDQSFVDANPDYYLGKPAISKMTIAEYPSVRAAWAEMLRGNLDMVYEVGTDELDSLQSAKTINVYSVVRHYQFVVILNRRTPSLSSPAVRIALNNAIDRPALVRDAMAGHGLPSSGPVWPNHWAIQGQPKTADYDPTAAARTIATLGTRKSGDGGPKLQFTCLVAPDAERVALVVKEQLEAVGVDMVLRETSPEELRREAGAGRFDAIITSIISGPSIFRPYLWWYSKGPLNRAGYRSPEVDSALDTVRHALTDDEYRRGVLAFQKSILLDPPAIFLAWTEGARAVSTRFDMAAQPGTDIIRTLHLWRPVAGRQGADKN